MSDHGHMDVTEHKQTYHDFLTLLKWSGTGIAIVLVILAATVV